MKIIKDKKTFKSFFFNSNYHKMVFTFNQIMMFFMFNFTYIISEEDQFMVQLYNSDDTVF